MRKNLLYLSIVACLSFSSSYAFSQTSESDGFDRDSEYYMKLEAFLNDSEEVEEKKKVEENLENSKKTEKAESETVMEENKNFLKKGESNNKEKTSSSEKETTLIASNEKVLNKLYELRKLLDKKIDSSVYDDSLKDIEKRLNSMEKSLNADDNGFVSKDFLTDTYPTKSSVKEEISSLSNELMDFSEKLKEGVSSEEFLNFKNQIEEKIKLLTRNISSFDNTVDANELEDYKANINEKLNELSDNLKRLSYKVATKEEVDDVILSLENKIKEFSLVNKDKDDVIKDLRQDFFDKLKEMEKSLNAKEEINYQEKIASLQEDILAKEKEIKSQNAKIETIEENYRKLTEQVSQLSKNSNVPDNIIRVEDFENLNDAEKRVKKEGGVMILDKNGQLKVLD